MSFIAAILLGATLSPSSVVSDALAATARTAPAVHAVATASVVAPPPAPAPTREQSELPPWPEAAKQGNSICADFFGPVLTVVDLRAPCRNYAARRALRITSAVGIAVPLLALWAVLLFAYAASRRNANVPIIRAVDAVLQLALAHARLVGVAYVGTLLLLLLAGFRYHLQHCPTQDLVRCHQWGELAPT